VDVGEGEGMGVADGAATVGDAPSAMAKGVAVPSSPPVPATTARTSIPIIERAITTQAIVLRVFFRPPFSDTALPPVLRC
jgi:hypothetical protein